MQGGNASEYIPKRFSCFRCAKCDSTASSAARHKAQRCEVTDCVSAYNPIVTGGHGDGPTAPRWQCSR